MSCAKRLNRLKCYLGLDSAGPKEACIIRWGCALVSLYEYHWAVYVQRQCGLLSNYFAHLLQVSVSGWQQLVTLVSRPMFLPILFVLAHLWWVCWSGELTPSPSLCPPVDIIWAIDDCLEHKRKIIRTVLCCIVYDSCAVYTVIGTHVSSS